MTVSMPAPLPSDTLDEELFQVRNRALVRAILNNISEGVSIADASGNFIYTSPFADWVFGTGVGDSGSPEDWHKHGIFHSDEHTPFPIAQLPIWRALKGEEVRDVDMFVRNANVPQGRHVRCHCLPLRDAGGQIIGGMSLVKDMDKVRQSEEEKRRLDQRFRILMDTAREGFLAVDGESHITYANGYMGELLGVPPKEMIGKSVFVFLDPSTHHAGEQRLERRRRGIADTKDFKLVRRDGTSIWTSVSTTPFFDEQGQFTGVLAAIMDITARRNAEEQVRQLNAELERRIAERTAQLEFSNRELEAFAYSVAHDLRAPLRSIASFSDTLAEDCADSLDETGLDYLRRIRGGAQRMAELIDGILSLSRVNRMTLETRRCDLSAMAREISEKLQKQQPERKVRFIIQEGLVDQGDPQLLHSVLENLLGNAWKFTRESPNPEIVFGVTREQEVCPYFVRDNGAGFDMAYQEKLFGVFQRLHTRTEFEGNGVGLASVQRIIRRHGGRIWGEGQPGRGACFTFTLNELPLPPGTAAPTPGRRAYE